MSSPAQQARLALGQRLREIRKDSGLTARALAVLAGWHESKCSRIEHGKTPPSDDDIRVWTRHCRAEAQAADLIATARNVEGMYIEWRRLERTGLKKIQEAVSPLWERTRLLRVYSPWLIPGPLQTRPYIEALLRSVRDRRSLPDDVEEAAKARVDRQRILHQGGRFIVLLEESALRYRLGDAETMAGQLGHLLSVATLPSVSVGIIPLATDRQKLRPVEGFFLFDEVQVNVELVSAFLTVTQPWEIELYVKTFAMLADMAVYGPSARGLITSAVDALS